MDPFDSPSARIEDVVLIGHEALATARLVGAVYLTLHVPLQGDGLMAISVERGRVWATVTGLELELTALGAWNDPG